MLFPSRDPVANQDGDLEDDEPDEDTGPFSSSEQLHQLLTATGWRDPTSREQDHEVRFTDAGPVRTMQDSSDGLALTMRVRCTSASAT